LSKIFEALQKAQKEKQRMGAVATKVTKSTEKGGKVSSVPPEVATLSSAAFSEKELPKTFISPWLVVCRGNHHYVAEQIKRIKTHILHSFPEGNAPRTIMVTSAGPGEGKSFVAANLAATMAQGIKESAILVDADMRHPDLHKFFGLPAVPGLSDFLMGQVTLEEVIKDTGVPKLKLVPGGSIRENTVELVSSDAMKAFISKVLSLEKEGFIILDTTPVVVTNEPKILASHMDAIVVVVRHNSTPREALNRALNLVGRDKILGLVFNDAPQGMMRLYGHAYSGYYYGTRYGPEKTRVE